MISSKTSFWIERFLKSTIECLNTADISVVNLSVDTAQYLEGGSMAEADSAVGYSF